MDLDKPEVRQSEVTPFEQARGYNDSLPSDYKVSTIVTSNFERFRFYNLRSQEGIRGEKYEECALEEVPEKLELFIELFHGRPPKEEYSILDAPSTEKAAEKISKLYSLFAEEIDSTPLSDNSKSRYKKQIPLIIMRMVFLLFANNTSQDRGKIFKHDQFRTFLEKSTDDTHFTRDLLDLFRCLDIPETDIDSRFTVMPEVRDFPYIDRGLFKSDVEFPQFPEGTRKELLDLVSDFKYWDRINISVFGPIMDCVFGGTYRRENGIYYTSRENILKVINPLFMDDLKHELEEIKRTKDFEKQRSDLDAFHGKLSRLQFFDPACGSGNFLTETYMELRDLEDEVIALESSTSHNLNNEIKVSLSQFHGIELNPYAVTVARTALQIAREEALERSYARFSDLQSVTLSFLPLKDELKGIVCGNALTMDWGDLVSPSKDLFIFGNPPFAGDYNKSKEQQTEMKRIFANLPSSELDYCAAWYYKAAVFLNGSGAQFAFVSTNSVTQGIQVEGLFKPVFH
ncbi:MAG: class I SAM-dependent DNA methyltransferase, partial [Bifidobacteriaceae bacterium]|nr:class I SAM-dependent DNA methyltransferase [Bifidobacteriaceae bacterium]